MLKSLLGRLRPTNSSAAPAATSILRSLLPLALIAIAVTALIVMFMWREQASFKPLFGAREKVAASDMMAVLDGAGIPYRVHPDSGQVLVPEDRLGEVRMLLASKGVVAKLPAGLELMDSKDPLGVSQFVQDVRFRRGLEGELAQSIMTIDAVETARVHISVARTSSFVVTGGEKSSASVVLTLKPGRELADEQIAAIVNMVASSAADLDPKRVTLVDQSGHFLSARVDLTDGFQAGKSNDAAKRYQDEMRANVRELLAPVVGDENFKISVTADVDNDRVNEMHEQYGDTPKVTNEAVRAEMDREPLALGVPGSLSNRPIAVPSGAAAPSDQNSAQKNASTRQFAYDRSVTQIERSRGRLRKVNVAVLLNSTAAPAGAKAWSDQQLADVDKMLRSGLGIDATRGDTLVVSALAFPNHPTSATPWWQERDTIVDAGGWAIYLVGMLLAFFFILRPLMKLAQQRLALPAPVAAAAPTPIEATVMAQGAAAAAAPPPAIVAPARRPIPVGPLLEDYDLPPHGSPVDVMVEHLKLLAAKEPERVAEVVKQWVQKNVRSE